MAQVKTFEVKGYMVLRYGERRKFTLYLRGLSEREVLESAYSLLGSRHKVTRNHIKVESVSEVPPENVKDNYVKELSRTDKIVVYA